MMIRREGRRFSANSRENEAFEIFETLRYIRTKNLSVGQYEVPAGRELRLKDGTEVLDRGEGTYYISGRGIEAFETREKTLALP